MQDSMSLGSPQDLLTGVRTRSCKDLLHDFIRISTRRICAREDFTQISTRSLHKELCQKGPFREDFARITTRSSHKDLNKIMQDLLGLFHATGSSHKDLYQIRQGSLRKDAAKIFSQGPPFLCEPAQSKCTCTCHRSHFMRGFTGKMPQTKVARQTLCEPAQSKCTWACHKNIMREITGKNAADQLKPIYLFSPVLLHFNYIQSALLSCQGHILP